ncbi:MAG: alpha/beta fold hydrolase, partial [Nitrospirae bacterium]
MSQGDKQKLNVRGFNLAYLRRGKGEPLLLIHGITTYSFIWQDVIPHLQGSFDVIAIDLLGCGDSDKPTNTDYSLKAQAELIKDFLEALGLDRVHLVCHDIGGGIGQVLSVKYPERLKTLTLINTVGYDYWPVQPIKSLRIPFFRQMAMAVMDLGLFRAIIKRAIYHKERLTDELMEQFLRPLRTKEGRQGFLHLAKCLNNRDLLEIEEKLKDLEIPVLIIRG